MLAHNANNTARFCRSTILPVEVLELIFQELSPYERYQVMLSSTQFHAVASRIQYRSIDPSQLPRQYIGLLKVLGTNTHYSSFVRSLTLDLYLTAKTSNFLRLLNRAFRQLPSLQELNMELYPRDSVLPIPRVFDGCTFSLRKLATSVACDALLARFLETQNQLTELTLTGYRTSSPFIVSPSAMPRLSTFRTVHVGIPVLSQILSGRPIQVVSMSLFPDEKFEPLDALVSCNQTIKKLTLLSLDRTPLEEILVEVSSRLPDLEALHVIVLLARCTSVSAP